MSATIAIGDGVPPAQDEDLIPPPSPPPAFASESSIDLVDASASGFTQAVLFSSGNPRIEETRGIIHLFPEEAASSSSNLPARRKPLVCVIAVPNHMTYADFYRFCGAFIQHMLETRIVRTDDVEDQYCVIIRFDDQNSADEFFQYFNGRRFSSLESDICNVRYTVDVQYTGSIKHVESAVTSSGEQPSCPVCLERLDQDNNGILTTICNHSFHCSCISKWTDSSCPSAYLCVMKGCIREGLAREWDALHKVCRYCQQQPEKSTCSVCGTSENVCICVICGFVGCGRYKEGHAIRHWKETQHCYSLELETQRVWDHVGDNYVHRLIQSKTDGKLVELNFHCTHADEKYGNCTCNEEFGLDEALLNSKLEAVVGEYNDLLTSQLDNQRKYYESLLLEIKEATEKEVLESIGRAVSIKLHKLQMKLDRCIEEKKFHEDINENLVKNQEVWKTKFQQLEEREQTALRQKDAKIRGLEEQLRDLIVHIESQKVINEPPNGSIASEIVGGSVLPVEPAFPSSIGSSKQGKKTRRK